MALNASCTPGTMISPTLPTQPHAPPWGATSVVQPPSPGTEPASALSMAEFGSPNDQPGVDFASLWRAATQTFGKRSLPSPSLGGGGLPSRPKERNSGRNSGSCHADWCLNFHLIIFIAEQLRTSFLISLSLSFLICTMGARRSFSSGFC